jgi:hypothetical protein
MDQHEVPFVGGTPVSGARDGLDTAAVHAQEPAQAAVAQDGGPAAGPEARSGFDGLSRSAPPDATDAGDLAGVRSRFDAAGSGAELEPARGRTLEVFGGSGGPAGRTSRGQEGDRPPFGEAAAPVPPAGLGSPARDHRAVDDSGELTAFGAQARDETAGDATDTGFSAFGTGPADGEDGALDDSGELIAFGAAADGRAPAGAGFSAFGTGSGAGEGGAGAPGTGSGDPVGGSPVFDAFGTEDPAPGGRISGAAAQFGSSRSFDGFAAGAGQSGARPLPVPAAGADGDHGAAPGGTGSLFDSTKPVPRMSRPARDPLAPELGTPSGGNARVPRILTGDLLLTINSVDGTEVVPCPPEERRTPARRTRAERAARMAAARPAPPPGPPVPEPPLLERDEERERLVRLLARGRSVRVTGPSGAGRTALLDAVAGACGDLAPDGVLRVSGYRRTSADVLHDLYAIAYAADGYRPGRDELPGLLKVVGAVVVLDDLEFGGAALEEVLAAAPECAFLMSATPDVPAPAADSMVEEVFLSGLTRTACVDLLQLVAGRRLEEDETAWAADLWFESEGLPLRFVQAGALLRQRDALRLPPEPADWDDSVWENGSPAAEPAGLVLPDLTGFDPVEPMEPAAGPAAEAVPALPSPDASAPGRLPASEVPLPSLAESAAPADLLASRLSESAREALAFAVALDGECPHPSHLPALVGDTHGDAALGELTSVGLAVPVDSHFRLAAGVVQQLSVTLAADDELSDVQAHTAALHYSWWAGHPSVTPERAATESEAIIAAMTACRDGGHASASVLLARTVAPVFAAALHWGAWERALRIGQEAARLSGEVAEEAYFHHELGVLALCTGSTDRARAELEASIALRGALADRQGSVVGRRTLALVLDRAGQDTAGELAAGAPLELPPAAEPAAVVISRALPAAGSPAAAAGGPGSPSVRRLAVAGSRRNLVAAGTGVLLAAVLGTIVTLGATSGSGGAPNQVKPVESVQQDSPDDSTPPAADGTTASPVSTSPSTTPSATSASPGTTPPSGTGTSSPTGGTTTPPGSPTTTPPAAGRPGGGSKPTTRPTTPHTSTPPSSTPSQSTSPSPSNSSSPSPSPSDTTTTPSTSTNSQSATASSPVTQPETPSAGQGSSSSPTALGPSSSPSDPGASSGPSDAGASSTSSGQDGSSATPALATSTS